MFSGRALILAGILLIVLGLVVSYGDRLPFRPGQLPGDIVIRSKNTTFYFPLVSCLIASAVLSLLAWIFSRR